MGVVNRTSCAISYKSDDKVENQNDSPFGRLPSDILRIIFKHVSSHPPSLAACTRTCRKFFVLAIAQLDAQTNLDYLVHSNFRNLSDELILFTLHFDTLYRDVFIYRQEVESRYEPKRYLESIVKDLKDKGCTLLTDNAEAPYNIGMLSRRFLTLTIRVHFYRKEMERVLDIAKTRTPQKTPPVDERNSSFGPYMRRLVGHFKPAPMPPSVEDLRKSFELMSCQTDASASVDLRTFDSGKIGEELKKRREKLNDPITLGDSLKSQLHALHLLHEKLYNFYEQLYRIGPNYPHFHDIRKNCLEFISSCSWAIRHCTYLIELNNKKWFDRLTLSHLAVFAYLHQVQLQLPQTIENMRQEIYLLACAAISLNEIYENDDYEYEEYGTLLESQANFLQNIVVKEGCKSIERVLLFYAKEYSGYYRGGSCYHDFHGELFALSKIDGEKALLSSSLRLLTEVAAVADTFFMLEDTGFQTGQILKSLRYTPDYSRALDLTLELDHNFKEILSYYQTPKRKLCNANKASVTDWAKKIDDHMWQEIEYYAARSARSWKPVDARLGQR